MDKEDVVYICNGILLSHKKNEILPFVKMWMDLEGIMLSEISQRKTNTVFHLHVESKKLMNIHFKKKRESYRYRGQPSGYQRRGGWRERNR